LDVERIRQAERCVKLARRLLRLARADSSRRYAQALLKSIQGALRHAERCRAQQPDLVLAPAARLIAAISGKSRPMVPRR
jgi:hypothetical protein